MPVNPGARFAKFRVDLSRTRARPENIIALSGLGGGYGIYLLNPGDLAGTGQDRNVHFRLEYDDAPAFDLAYLAGLKFAEPFTRLYMENPAIPGVVLEIGIPLAPGIEVDYTPQRVIAQADLRPGGAVDVTDRAGRQLGVVSLAAGAVVDLPDNPTRQLGEVTADLAPGAAMDVTDRGTRQLGIVDLATGAVVDLPDNPTRQLGAVTADLAPGAAVDVSDRAGRALGAVSVTGVPTVNVQSSTSRTLGVLVQSESYFIQATGQVVPTQILGYLTGLTIICVDPGTPFPNVEIRSLGDTGPIIYKLSVPAVEGDSRSVMIPYPIPSQGLHVTLNGCQAVALWKTAT